MKYGRGSFLESSQLCMLLNDTTLDSHLSPNGKIQFQFLLFLFILKFHCFKSQRSQRQFPLKRNECPLKAGVAESFFNKSRPLKSRQHELYINSNSFSHQRFKCIKEYTDVTKILKEIRPYKERRTFQVGAHLYCQTGNRRRDHCMAGRAHTMMSVIQHTDMGEKAPISNAAS